MPIFVVNHLKSAPPRRPDYFSIGVGKKSLRNDLLDSTGENISNLNFSFCELTAVYWVWRNFNIDSSSWIGFFHYRRNLAKPRLWDILLRESVSSSDIDGYLSGYDLVLPRHQVLTCGIVDHYGLLHVGSDMELALHTLLELGRIDRGHVERFKSLRSAYFFNMFVMRPALFQDYCSWLFPPLFEVHSRLDYTGRDIQQQRAIGFLAERLFNLWLLKNPSLTRVELPVLRMDKNGIRNVKRYFLG